MRRYTMDLSGKPELVSYFGSARRTPPGFLAVLFLAAAAVTVAQEELPTFTVDTREVDLYISVGDKDGKPITNIPQSAFKVYENGVEQPIKAFSNRDVPVSMGIVIDNSGSMRDKRASVNAA
jgi:Ca-activated chloride channel family protein